MSWTAPKTWNPGDVQSASDLNTYVRDNPLYLLQRPGSVIIRDNNASYTTTATSFVDIDGTNLAITLTLSGGKVLLGFTGVLNGSGGTYAQLDFTVDGNRVGPGADGIAGAYAPGGTGTQGLVAMTVLVTDLAAGLHTFKVQWKSSIGTPINLYAGNGTALQDFTPVFWAMEVG